MTDIYTNILPDTDEGAESMEEALKMAKKAIDNGVTKIICTPHYVVNSLFDKNTYQSTARAFNKFKKELKKQDHNIEIYLGREIYYNENLFQLLEKDQDLSVNKSKYLLIEFSKTKKTNIKKVVKKLRKIGYIPIIAGPELYKYVTGVDQIKEWVKYGALIQINWSSYFCINGFKTRVLVKKLLENNLVDFISSGNRSYTRRPISLNKSYQKITKKYGREIAEKIFIENPDKILYQS